MGCGDGPTQFAVRHTGGGSRVALCLALCVLTNFGLAQ